jgi:glycosyltransferase involved in cell wall biosynthesis
VKVLIVSPYPLGDPKGNSVTALRIEELLGAAGIEAKATHGYDGSPADALISLHARKGAGAIEEFQRCCPGKKTISLLTGTDLYLDLPEGRGKETLERADHLVVMHSAAVQAVPEQWRAKLSVVPKSFSPFEVEVSPSKSSFVISVIGHLRPVKRPFLPVEAAFRNPEWNVEIWQVGEALDQESFEIARDWMRREKRYRFVGKVLRKEALELCAKSDLSINCSLHEGGANSVLEAMMIGVPVLASPIPGNVGLLGENYPGYYSDLEESLKEIVKGKVDLGKWVEAAAKRLPLFSEESERDAWIALLNSP